MADRRIHLNIRGIVQGVGFRPFLHRLTLRYSLTGWARNTDSGVELELQGPDDRLDGFLSALKTDAPPLSVIREVIVSSAALIERETGFSILSSVSPSRRVALVSPDIGICPDCLRELMTPSNRRYRYPFINCTNCGPRFSIIHNIPYDRESTSMSDFSMCSHCESEYTDISDRRYHAQPNCCSRCGPVLTWRDSTGTLLSGDPLSRAAETLRCGGIIAVKGLGAIHLSCTPDGESIARLRQRKHRDEKPLAIMCANIEAARSICYISQAEESLLTGWRRPIVLLKKKPEAPDGLSDNRDLGVMLPYTPLHCLLMEHFPYLVMTSANHSDFPAIIDNRDALLSLSGIADGYLLHNRKIVTRCDDSLMRIFRGVAYPLRRSRGYAPEPLRINEELSTILACGGEQKSSFSLSRGFDVFLSQHIGDLKNAQTLSHYEAQINHFKTLFSISPELFACDAHPDYLSTVYAENCAKKAGLPLYRVQHHHAHMVSCMTDNGLDGSCIGLIWDGTGYGTDGVSWGGECLVGDAAHFSRIGSLRPISLPGGDLCSQEIWRTACSLLWDSALPVSFPNKAAEKVFLQLQADLNCPRSSGMGRLFDGVYALLTGRSAVAYEGQAPILLEAMATPTDNVFPISFYEEDSILRLDTRPVISALVQSIENQIPAAELAGAFMNTLSSAGLIHCREARKRTGLSRVVLSGGVFQNIYLLSRLTDLLTDDGFQVYHHSRVSTNDEGISLGQTVIAHAMHKEVKRYVPCNSPSDH